MNTVKRVLVKLSGGALSSKEGELFSREKIEHIVREVKKIKSLGVEVAIVVGGGNILRGSAATSWGIKRVEADTIGILGTLVNALMLRAAFEHQCAFEIRVMTAIKVNQAAEPYIRLRAQNHLKKGYLVIFAGGIGQPFVTTDYPSVQRAIEMECDLLLVAKEGIDGVYDGDPNKMAGATKYSELAYDDFIQQDLKVMDQSAILLAKEHGLPLHIFDFNAVDAMKRICQGESIGTRVTPQTTLKAVQQV